ncbi:isopentenyl-diphosphate Delta-isomerase [Actinoplanes sp. KI2]|uniref:isopentenyl-diphosphate Delta-isomerase n=1 Tax=Actinoplanes sp. KI2 TaxID=2983315 RepID=UPI0021D59594|nr:isopentenyl-diphosphate Delta-isomerase [Actinoplanes sp. KI2]MCU7728304.1 isopentenyl-diphosphate Delta-isomerase [Actinoplanes sp. KI2]
MTIAREAHLVDLVDPSGTSIGEATVEAAHVAPGRLHRAFSVFLRDPASGQVLLQQRAAVKTRFPLRWANTCCGHPLPGEDVRVAAQRRLAEELGVTGVPLTPVGVYTYRAEDPATGRVEHEYDHVLLGDLPAPDRFSPDRFSPDVFSPDAFSPDRFSPDRFSPDVFSPDAAEVADLRWEYPAALLAGLSIDPARYAPWLAGVTGCLVEHLALEQPGGR